MPWANLDDQYPNHPKVVGLSDSAFRLHVCGICYSAQYLTDGLIRVDMVPLLVPRYRSRALEELTKRGVWHAPGETCDEPRCIAPRDGYVVHDYLQWNRSRQEVAEERDRIHEARSKAGKKGAAARWQNR